MIEDSLYFGLDENYYVDFYLENDSTNYKGELKISPRKVPSLKIDNNFLKNDDKIIKIIYCNSGNNKFVLLDSDNYEHIIYPKYIIKGNYFNNYNDIKFSGMHLYLSNYYKWVINNELINNTKKINKFNIKITKPDSKVIEITNRYNSCIKEFPDEKRKSIIENYPTIDISCVNSTFSIKEIIDLSYEMRQIFSYLMGYSLNIYYIWGYIIKKHNDKEYQKWIPIYIASTIKNNEILDSKNYSFIRSDYIKKDKWEKIFNNFYSKEKYSNFKFKWSRLLGLLDYSDIWDYEITGYFILFDSCLDKFKSKKSNPNLKINKKIFSKFKEELKLKLGVFLKENNITKRSKCNKNIIESMEGYISNLHSYDYPTVNQKFERWCFSINKSIRNIIDLTKEEFDLIKDFRHDTSHANIVEDKKYDINKLYTIKNKISLFLFYHIYSELGFTTKDFIKFLKITLHPLRRNSNLNEEALDRLSDNIPFIEINENDLNKINSLKTKWNIILEHDDKNNFSYNEEITKKYEINYVQEIKKYKFLHDYVKDLYSNKIFKEVKYVGPMYVTNNKLNVSIKLHNTFFVEI